MSRRPLPLAALLLAGASPAAGQHLTWDDVRVLPPLPPGERFAYGADVAQHVELRLPDGPGPHPVAVLVHGGCWLSIADLRYVERLGRELNRAGWATWNLEFRRLDEPGGEWPGIFRDVGRGVDALRDVASSRSLDLGRIVALGHSSGGHLALWLAARLRLPPDSELFLPDALPVQGVVGLAPIGDPDHLDAVGDHGCEGGPERLVGGDGPLRDVRMAHASPARLLPLGVPQLVVVGAADVLVPPAHSLAWVEEAREAGDDVELLVVPAAGHFEIVAPSWLRWPEVRDPLLAFMDRVTRRGRVPDAPESE